MAFLDAVLSPEWEIRHVSYNAHWAPQQELASLRDGQGSQVFLVWTPLGLFAKGYDAEAGSLDGAPEAVAAARAELPAETGSAFFDEPAFAWDELTFFGWRRTSHDPWRWIPPVPSARNFLLRHVTGDPQDYRHWALEYFDSDLPPNLIQRAFEGGEFAWSDLLALNPDASRAAIRQALAELGQTAIRVVFA